MRNPASFALAMTLASGLCFAGPALAGSTHSHSHGHSHGTAHSTFEERVELASAEISGIVITTPVIRATPPAAPAAGGFITLENTGSADDTLVAARISADVARKVELHTMEMDGDIMRMFEVEGGIAVPAGETVTLAPGGLHIMFMGLEQQLTSGTLYDVTLVFESAGEVTLPFAVMPLTQVRDLFGGGHKGSDHGGHAGH